jgi:hypothetical protein
MPFTCEEYVRKARRVVFQGDKKENLTGKHSTLYIKHDDRQGVKKDLLLAMYPKWYNPKKFGLYRMWKVDEKYFSFQERVVVHEYEKEIREAKMKESAVKLRREELIAYYGNSWDYNNMELNNGCFDKV